MQISPVGETRSNAETGPVGLAQDEGKIEYKKNPVPGSIVTVQCTTLQYITTLKVCCEALREIIDILSPIRADSVEGANGLKVLVGEGELDWFSHLHTQQGKKGGSCQQLTRGVQQRYPAYVDILTRAAKD